MEFSLALPMEFIIALRALPVDHYGHVFPEKL